MRVDQIELYHIHRNNHHDDSWYTGNLIHTPTLEHNYFYDGIITATHSKVSANSDEQDLIKYLGDNFVKFEEFIQDFEAMEVNEYSVRNLKNFNWHVLSVLNQTLDSLLYSRKAFRELIFENVRQSNYSELPSRQKCFWLCELNDVETWWNDFKDKEEKSIFKIVATGNLFKADGSHIQLDIFKLTDFINSAELYWKGLNHFEENNLPELLFEGNLKIVTKYDNPSQIIKDN